jgi:Mrp family chromosome partitioning ATPase/capsular polysaccharide biosynthesis protein
LNTFGEQSVAPGSRDGALPAYFAAIRAHPLIVVLVTLTAVAASVGFLLVRSPRYEATADILVNPLPRETQVFLGLPLIRDAGDPARTAQTAASLIESRAAADLTAQRLGGGWDGERVLDAVKVAPRGESNVLGVTATTNQPAEAARVATTFSRAALETREADIVDAAQELITQLEARQRALPAESAAREEIGARLEQLQTIIAGGDPALSLSQDALPPDSAVGASSALILALAILAGVTLGSGAAVLLELLARRVRDEDDAFAVYPLPVLLRVPELPARRLDRLLGSNWHMPPEVREPFRTLAVQLDERAGGGVLMVTSPSAGDGKTTCAMNLAVSLAATGKSVVLLDFDLRKPDVGAALGLKDAAGFMELVDPNDRLEPLLQTVSDVWSVRVLALQRELNAGVMAGLVDLVGRRLPELLAEARELADYVVIDTAPLGEVGDALRLVRDVDEIVLMLRPGNTNRVQLETVRELLEPTGERPLGYIVLGRTEAPRGTYGYGHARRPGAEPIRRALEPVRADAPDAAPEAPNAESRASSVGRAGEAPSTDASEGAAASRVPRDPARPGRPARRG